MNGFRVFQDYERKYNFEDKLMPLNAAEIAVIGSATLDFNQRNKPIDQINHDRPLLTCLEKKKRSFPAAKELISEKIVISNASNFQYYRGAQVVTHNHRDIIRTASYTFTNIHDGFFLSEDELSNNGITVHDGKKGQGTKSEREQLVNLIEVQGNALDEGFREKFDFELHLDGTQNVDAIAGLDHLVSLNPALGVVGGIDRAISPYWRNQSATGLTVLNVISVMEQIWRNCTRNGGTPDKILVGSNFLDLYATAAAASNRVIVQNGKQGNVEGGRDKVYFKGVELEWNPTAADVDAALAPLVPWENRCYMLNTRHISLRPMAGQDMVNRTPVSPHNQYISYFAKTWKGGLTMNRSNAHAVLAIA